MDSPFRIVVMLSFVHPDSELFFGAFRGLKPSQNGAHYSTRHERHLRRWTGAIMHIISTVFSGIYTNIKLLKNSLQPAQKQGDFAYNKPLATHPQKTC